MSQYKRGDSTSSVLGGGDLTSRNREIGQKMARGHLCRSVLHLDEMVQRPTDAPQGLLIISPYMERSWKNCNFRVSAIIQGDVRSPIIIGYARAHTTPHILLDGVVRYIPRQCQRSVAPSATHIARVDVGCHSFMIALSQFGCTAIGFSSVIIAWEVECS